MWDDSEREQRRWVELRCRGALARETLLSGGKSDQG
jgi:hypothetical protein